MNATPPDVIYVIYVHECYDLPGMEEHTKPFEVITHDRSHRDKVVDSWKKIGVRVEEFVYRIEQDT
jgi:hypothetical protein